MGAMSLTEGYGSRGAAGPCETPCLGLGRGGHPRTYNVGDVGLWSIPQTRIYDGFPTTRRGVSHGPAAPRLKYP